MDGRHRSNEVSLAGIVTTPQPIRGGLKFLLRIGAMHVPLAAFGRAAGTLKEVGEDTVVSVKGHVKSSPWVDQHGRTR
jgi:hypothetical protein